MMEKEEAKKKIKEELGELECMKCLEEIDMTEGDKLTVVEPTHTELESMKKEFPLVVQRIRNAKEGTFHSECYEEIFSERIGIEDPEEYWDGLDLDDKDIMNQERCPECAQPLLYDERYDDLDDDKCPSCGVEVREKLGEPPFGVGGE